MNNVKPFGEDAVKLTEVVPLIIGALLWASLFYFLIDFKPFFLMIIVTIAYFVTLEIQPKRQKCYRCPNCGYTLAKKDAQVSGYDSEQTLPYNTANRRVRALEEHGYIEKSGERKTKTGFAAKLYQLTARAYLAMLLKRIDIDEFIEKATDSKMLTALATFI